jgi:hypothetical protein
MYFHILYESQHGVIVSRTALTSSFCNVGAVTLEEGSEIFLFLGTNLCLNRLHKQFTPWS